MPLSSSDLLTAAASVSRAYPMSAWHNNSQRVVKKRFLENPVIKKYEHEYYEASLDNLPALIAWIQGIHEQNALLGEEPWSLEADDGRIYVERRTERPATFEEVLEANKWLEEHPEMEIPESTTQWRHNIPQPGEF